MILSKLLVIKSFILDVDGVLTDATVLVTESGEQLRRFNVRDGYAIKLAIRKGFKICAISGGYSETIAMRLRTLGITEIYLGAEQKLQTYKDFMASHALAGAEVLYIGDDIPDLPVMKLAGVAACPADAVEEVKAISAYISPKKGGEGCVREIIEKVLKLQDKWYSEEHAADEQITST
ncbi:KdsC family phosphatase [Hufsiella ginkgonis]|uniref:HAD hydrolase family protein n=1 Tax=Hufsiella ginkgonis TaxID=2695274 RepID=A0A7K1XX66_9SPHI|nr:HAD-IIIA family hydrolase [Hufsiella ginkgonis]MXV15591.1 HAD hydrolase family protein [Hufsiella ginkgonis]